MRIALLSFHNAFNYGAALQAYGLQKAVEELGVSCEYIDYVNTFRKEAYHVPSQIAAALREKNLVRALRVLLGSPLILRRGRMFRRFYDSYLKKTEKTYGSSKEAAALNDVYDKFIVGSDQVWNYHNNGADWAYLLDFVTDSRKKLAYSSSFGVSEIPEEYREAYRTNLAGFGRLAVRETLGVRLVEKLTGRKAHLVLDPVFLVGVETWETIRRSVPNTAKGEYVFFYTNAEQQVMDFLDTGYPMEGLSSHILSSHITVRDFLDPHIKVCSAMAPEAFLNEIAEAKLVVTASFHCAALAIMFHKPLCVILTGNRGKDERIRNLLKICGLESRVLTSETTVRDILSPIDYERVDAALRPYYEKSRAYLRSAIFDLPDVDYENELPREEGEARFCTDERCTGCTACAAACPAGAIRMEADREGFLRPTVDETLCTHCGTCHAVCQVFAERTENCFPQRYFAFKNRDEIRRHSSSGGIFTALSDRGLRRGGVIVGAAMDESFHVRHVIAETCEERDRMRQTCYVQSDPGDCFAGIRKMLEGGREVLFVGTPCQVRGLRLFLGRDWDTLLTVDLVCHGAPSPLVFEQFIHFLEEKGHLERFSFRDKELGWRGYHVSGVIDGRLVKDKLWLQSFNNLFSHNVINRISCASCPYTNYDRPGDLTIGDFWGIREVAPLFYDKLGVSLILCSTGKGMRALEELKELDEVEILETEKTKTAQNSLKKPGKASSCRAKAFRILQKEGYAALAKALGEWNAKGWIKDRIRKIAVR